MKGSWKDFFADIEQHKRRSKEFLQKIHKFPLPSFSNQAYYSKKVEENEKKRMNQKVQSFDPYLYKKFLGTFE